MIETNTIDDLTVPKEDEIVMDMKESILPVKSPLSVKPTLRDKVRKGLLITIAGLSTLLAGQVLYHGAHTTYEVKSGDTIYGISRRFDVDESVVREGLGVSGDLIKPGQKLDLYAFNLENMREGSPVDNDANFGEIFKYNFGNK